MKISVTDFIELIEEEKYATKAVAIKESEFGQKIDGALEEASVFGEDSLDSGKLFEFQINIANTTFLIQSGIINLPFQDAKKVTHFFEDGQEVETKLYLTTKSEFINKSKLRIEKVADDSVIDDSVKKTIVDFMDVQLREISENEKESKEK